MQNVVIVSQIQSYLIVSLKEWFERADYEVITVKADIDAINQIDEPVGIFLLYVDEKMVEERQALNYIKDRAAEEDIPLFEEIMKVPYVEEIEKRDRQYCNRLDENIWKQRSMALCAVFRERGQRLVWDPKIRVRR